MKNKKSTIEELKNEGLIKPAIDIPVPERKIEVIERSQLEALQEIELDRENGERLRYLAKAKKVPLEDLFIWIEENYGKKVDKATTVKKGTNPVIIQDFTKENAIGKPYNPFNNPLFASKIKKGGG